MEIGVFFEFQLCVSAMLASLQTFITDCIIIIIGCTAYEEENSFHGLECIIPMHVKVHPLLNGTIMF